METKFKIVMRKDKKVLEDFIVFANKANAPMQQTKMAVIAVGFILIGWLARRDSLTAGIVISLLGILVLLYVLFRYKLAARKLAKVDEAYINQNELSYEFTNSNIYIRKDGELERNVGSYSHVSCLYSDEYNYYVGINNEDLLLLPKKCFVEGDEEEFMPFMEEKSKEESEFMPRTLKNKWITYKMRQKQRDAEYNEKAARLREEDRQKKEKRKNKK